MPYFRHRSFVFAPASASLSTPMICSSVNRRLFIRLLPDEQTLLHSGTNLGEQTTSELNYAIYGEQLFDWGNANLRAGLRYDRNGFGDENLLSPRFGFNYVISPRLRISA